MGKRSSSTLALICWTVLLIGAFAGVARLDRIVRTPRISHYDFFAPQAMPLPRVAADRAPTVAPPPPPARPVPAPVADDPEQRAQYEAEGRKTIIELQPYRQSESATLAGDRGGRATLINLNPTINSWYLLTISSGGGQRNYHLENSNPAGQRLQLSETGFAITTAAGPATPCDLTSGKPNALERAAATSLPYAPLCDGRFYLRNRVAGHYTDLERMTDFLRENVWNGDEIVGFVKQSLYQDAYRETGDTAQAAGASAPVIADAPLRASLRAADANTTVPARNFGVDVGEAPAQRLDLGAWYPVRGLPGVYSSVMQPAAVSEAIIRADKGEVNPLDGTEASALVHLVAFDLSQFDVNFAMGTDNPRLGWSPRAVMRTDRMPGPDGINSSWPLVTNGIVNPTLLNRIAATFAGGFKREHGAFKWGELSHVRWSSHYGFIEHGVVFSKLQPGLATLYVLDDGSVHMETWIKDYDRLLPHVAFARQNGVPLVELDSKGTSIPGAFVDNWGAGNWSGSADAKLRTLRAGVCMMQSGAKQYLVHALFTTATPSAMAVVFQAYNCRYAMLLDMNALEHSYLALYARQGDKLVVEHPVAGMTEIDRTASGQLVPRFVGYPDNRDFFYLVRRRSSP
ncbi:MAG: hypothetical protein GC190_07860 [Alphaproteobacteria bacterium]|nr:hypothetical protein [Alphaproteobacteria bacterium]